MSRHHAMQIFEAAVQAVQPAHLLQQHLYADDTHVYIAGNAIDRKKIHQFIVIAAGKADAAMAQQAEQQLANIITNGICIIKYEHALPLQKLKTMAAAHPVPDANSIKAGAAVLQLVNGLHNNDVVLVLISGGASALMADIPEGCTLQEVQTTFELLLKSGASIHQMNAVRKHLSKIKGGQLAKAAQPAKVFSLLLSDVVGDDLDTIASGPTAPDKSTFSTVHQVLQQYQLWHVIPESIRRHLTKGLDKLIADTPKINEAFFTNTFTQIIGSNKIALGAAAQLATQLGYHTIIYKENVTADTVKFARALLQQYKDYNGPLPACILAGGETTLQVTGTGKGGRNQHLVLCALDELSKHLHDKKNITILSAGTDGTDGPTDAAGAVAGAAMLQAGIPIKKYVENFDAWHYFEQTGGLIKTGPTQTNVMDIMMVLIT
jgi:glycerate 2-kinase